LVLAAPRGEALPLDLSGVDGEAEVGACRVAGGLVVFPGGRSVCLRELGAKNNQEGLLVLARVVAVAVLVKLPEGLVFIREKTRPLPLLVEVVLDGLGGELDQK